MRGLWVRLLLAFLSGCILFFLAFAAVFNGYTAVAVVVVLACFAVGLVLSTRAPAPVGVAVTALAIGASLAVPAVPMVALFFVALLRESGLSDAAWWPGGLVAAFVLATAGAAAGTSVGRSRARRRGSGGS